MLAKIFRGTVLLVTSNAYLKDSLQRALLRVGYGIRIVRSQEEGFKVMREVNPAILLVDRRESGFSRLHHEAPLHLPIVTVMFHNDACNEHHCVMDLEDGATRAVCNASPALIVALLGAVLRRQRWEQTTPERYVADGVDIQLQKHEVKVDGALVPISPTQFRILESLITAPGHYLSRPALLDYVWGKGFAIIPHALDVHISSLRRKLNSNGTSPEFIQTVKGLGYKLRPMALPSEAPPIQPAHSVPTGIGLPSPRPYLPHTHAMNGSRFGGSQWRHKPERRIAARYRVKPLYTNYGDQG